MTTVFTSAPLDAGLEGALLERLRADHHVRPLGADDPRAVATRVAVHLADLGVVATRFRGAVSWAGVEVDHVWLAVALPSGPAVLDAAFPLHVPDFAAALAGYVAGLVSGAELAVLAARAPVEARVFGTFPPRAAYRGQPVWGSGRN